MPKSAIGVSSLYNDRPMANRYDKRDISLLDLEIVSDNIIIATARVESYHSTNYLGGIVTKDRNQIIWENDSAPLP